MRSSSSSQRRASSAIPKKYSVLVVDDDPNVLTSITRLLSDDVEVASALSAERALELLKVHSFHVVVSDFAMPGMDGNTLLGRISQMPQYVSCLLITGSDRYQPVAGEIRHYVLFKPFDPERLIRMVLELGRVAEMKRSVKLMTESISETRIKID
ncbi:MAG TPA: response regulator [Polyangiaceae bacterium]|nr:response regulator [Polyangiaceae bacterium]